MMAWLESCWEMTRTATLHRKRAQLSLLFITIRVCGRPSAGSNNHRSFCMGVPPLLVRQMLAS